MCRVRRRLKTEATHAHIQLSHTAAWQKRAQHCKAIILQLSKKLAGLYKLFLLQMISLKETAAYLTLFIFCTKYKEFLFIMSNIGKIIQIKIMF